MMSGALSLKVSVVMPCYNKVNYICESVASVLNQTHCNLELIIIDDCSTDASIELIKDKFGRDGRMIITVNSENRGANYCRNIGVGMATGRWLIFFDADDILHPQCLTRRVTYMNSHPDADFSVHTLETFKVIPGDGGTRWNPNSTDPLLDFLRHDLPWQTMQPIWTRKFLEKMDGFDESFNRLQDVEFHTRVFLQKDVKFYQNSNEPDCYYRTDIGRVNYGGFIFMERWVLSALQYCSKFCEILPQTEGKNLLGTIFQTYLSLLLSYKSRQIKCTEFDALERKIFAHKLVVNNGRSKWILLRITSVYNLFFFRLPGINRMLKKFFIA